VPASSPAAGNGLVGKPNRSDACRRFKLGERFGRKVPR
jgi:hypothetical protein